MADIVYCEWLKLKRSKIIFIGVLGSFIVPLLVITKNLTNDLSLYGIYEDSIMFIMLLFGPLVLAVVATYLVSREYTEKTLKTIFVVPIERRSFLLGKFITLFILVLLFMALSWFDIVLLAMLCSLFMEVSQLSLLSAIYIFIQMTKGGILLFTTLTPFVYLSLRAKGTLAPFIIIAAVSLLNVVFSGSQIAGFYPWTAAYLLLTNRLEQSGCPTFTGISILLFVCLSGIYVSMRRFQKEDIV